MISFEKISVTDELDAYRDYTAGLRLVDTYWENVIFDAAVYRIRFWGEPAGCFSICSRPDWKEYGFLTSFFLKPPYRYETKFAFNEIIRRYAPKGAYVVTSDEPFLSFALDCHTSEEPQAYFFDHEPERGNYGEYSFKWIRRAVEADLPDLEKTNFYHPVDIHSEENQLYVLRNDEGEFLGTGHIARMRLARQWGCVGMYTAPEHRRQGIGQSLILSMTRIAQEQGLIPIAGCYYQNAASRSTLEDCGFYSKTRYLRISF